MTNIDTVLAFTAAWNACDQARILALLDDDAIWENVPIEVLTGKAAIARKLTGVFAAVKAIDWRMLDIAQSATGAVLTERLDIIDLGDRRVELRIMGIFELSDGRITAWRDYFDLAQYRQQMGAAKW